MSLLYDNPEVRACFESDATQLLNSFQQSLVKLTVSEPPLAEYEVVQEIAHTFRGAAALVEVEAITSICTVFQRLFEIADTCKHTASSKAVEIFQFALSHLDRLLGAVTLSLQADEAGAKLLAAEVSSSAMQRWGDYFYEASDRSRRGNTELLRASSTPVPSPMSGPEESSVDEFLTSVSAEPAESPSAPVEDPGDTQFLPHPAADLGSSAERTSPQSSPVRLLPATAHGEELPAGPDAVTDFLSGVDTADSLAAPASAPLVAATTPQSGALAIETDLLPFFVEDAMTNLESLEAALQEWEKDPAKTAPLHAVYRHTHTIKGAANSTGLSEIGRVTHGLEDLISDCLEKRLPLLPSVLVNLLYEMSDVVKRAIAEVQSTGSLARSRGSFETLLQKTQAVRTGQDGAAGQAMLPAVLAVAGNDVPVLPVLEPAAPEGASESGEALEQQTLRINAQRLDEVMNLIGELVINRTRLDKKIVDIARFKEELNFCKSRLLEAIGSFQERFEYSGRRRRWSGSAPGGGRDGGVFGILPSDRASSGVPGEFSELEFDRYDEFNILARTLVEISNDTSEIIGQLDWFFGSFSEESAQFSKTTTELQTEVTRIRMVPLTFLLRRLQRAVRDAGQRERKDVEFRVTGGDTQLDKVIVDQIYSPLLHLVRNAVSHGLESAEGRQASGKAPKGVVRVNAFQEADRVVIEVTDDGRGLNFAAIRNEAVSRGWITADAQLTEEQLTHLIFRTGFSTARSVSEISGRGVGMDVVSAVVTKLNGSVAVRSRPGQGCIFTLRLPLTLAINQAMMISVGDQAYALPLSFVERIVPFDPDSVRVTGGAELWTSGGNAVPLIRLDDLFAEAGGGEAGTNVVLAKVANRSLALLVGDSLSKQDIVIKPMGILLAQHPYFSGATLTGDGNVVLILDLPGIEQSLGGARSGGDMRSASRSALPTASRGEQRRVLVVDDSLSVRKVAEKYLAQLGYDCVLAVDGLDALEKLRTETVCAVLTDLEMPRMHGYELISEIRHQPGLASLPIIVVTSRDAEKHRARARELGANEYVTKPFSRDQLAQRLERLLATATAA